MHGMPSPPDVLLVGHGTRDPRGLEEFQQLARMTAERLPDRAVESCLLELAPPDIAAGLGALAARGAQRVVVQPLLLFAAGHLQHDIPRAVQSAAERHPGLEWWLGQALESQTELVELSAVRYRQALTNRTQVPDDDTLLILVGRGSLDAAASAEMARFSRLRRQRTPVGRLEICYLAMSRPALNETLSLAAGLPFRRIVVQPHLLFPGELEETVRRSVEEWAALEPAENRPAKEWIVAPHLGPHKLLVDAIVARQALVHDERLSED